MSVKSTKFAVEDQVLAYSTAPIGTIKRIKACGLIEPMYLIEYPDDPPCWCRQRDIRPAPIAMMPRLFPTIRSGGIPMPPHIPINADPHAIIVNAIIKIEEARALGISGRPPPIPTCTT